MFELQPQPFESDVFGRDVGRLAFADGPAAPDLGARLSRATRDWDAQDRWLVSSRIPAQRTDLGEALREAGFRHVETLVTFERAIPANDDAATATRAATTGDTAACTDIARRAFRSDRFHADTRVPADGADELKARWVANSFSGRADRIVVRDDTDRLAGFCICLHRPPHAVIDLIATDPECQGKGHGRALVDGAVAAYAGQAATMRVGTQDSNARSRRLYEAAGFIEIERADTFHWMADGA